MLDLLPENLTEEERQRLLALLRSMLPNTVRVVSQPDMYDLGDGEFEAVTDEYGEPVYSHRNLLIEGAQLVRLEEQSLEILALENELADVSLAMRELREGKIARLLVLIYDWGEAALAAELDAGDLDAMPEASTWLSPLAPGETPELTYDMFAEATLEIRVTPIDRDEMEEAANGEWTEAFAPDAEREYRDAGYLTLAEQRDIRALRVATPAYRVQVLLEAEGIEVDIAPLLDSLEVSLSAQDLFADEEERLSEEGIAGDTMEALARESLSRHMALATIDSDGAIDSAEYRPGEYTTVLDTELYSGLPMNETALRALAETLQEQFRVRVVNGEAMTESARRVIVDYEGDISVEPEPHYRLKARAPASGLYLGIERG